MKRKTLLLFVAFAGITCLYSCTKDHTALPAPVNCTGVVDTSNTFSRNISVILANDCAYSPCHGGGSAQFGVDLSTYAGTVTAFQSQNFMCAVTSSSCGGTQMPLGLRPLSSTVIQQLQCWQAQGFPQ